MTLGDISAFGFIIFGQILCPIETFDLVFHITLSDISSCKTYHNIVGQIPLRAGLKNFETTDATFWLDKYSPVYVEIW